MTEQRLRENYHSMSIYLSEPAWRALKGICGFTRRDMGEVVGELIVSWLDTEPQKGIVSSLAALEERTKA